MPIKPSFTTHLTGTFKVMQRGRAMAVQVHAIATFPRPVGGTHARNGCLNCGGSWTNRPHPWVQKVVRPGVLIDGLCGYCWLDGETP